MASLLFITAILRNIFSQIMPKPSSLTPFRELLMAILKCFLRESQESVFYSHGDVSFQELLMAILNCFLRESHESVFYGHGDVSFSQQTDNWRRYSGG